MKKLFVMLVILLAVINAGIIHAQVVPKDNGPFMLAPKSSIQQMDSHKTLNAPSVSSVEKTYLGSGLYLLNDNIDPGSVLVEMKIGNDGVNRLITSLDSELQSITNLIYSKFKDDFDFIFFELDFTSYGNVDDALSAFGSIAGINMSVSNSVQGLGRDIFSNASSWGSAGKLKSVVFLPHYNLMLWGPALHEVCHNWAAFICPTYDLMNDPSVGHWKTSNAGGQLGGFRYVRTVEENSGGIAGKTKYQASMHPEKNSDGSFTNPGFGEDANGANLLPYSDIELYLMGMKSAQELRDSNFHLDIYSGNSFDITPEGLENKYFYSTEITSYTIDDIIALHGERIPDVHASQKHFKALTVLLKEDDAASLYGDQYEWIIWISKWFSGSYQFADVYNFNEATGGIGSLEMDGIKNSLKNLSNDATLSSLVVNTGTLTPAFNPNIVNYTVSVENTVTSIALTAIPNYAAASVTGAETKSLHLGENSFSIIVEAENGTQKTYTITVTRKSSLPGSSDATLSNLTISSGILTPTFSPNITNYTVNVEKTVTNITLTATSNHAGASVSGNGTKSLSIGQNPFDIVITSENGSIKTYTVIITRSTQSNADFEVVDGVLIAYHGNESKVVIPDNLGITTIGNGVFMNTRITSIIIPYGVTSIGEDAFRDTHSLYAINIPNSVTTIGRTAFSSSLLLTVNIPNGVTNIGDYAFSGSQLYIANIPNSVTNIGSNPFDGCPNLVNITVGEGNLNYISEDGVLFNKEKTSLISYPAGNMRDSYIIPNSVSNIENSAFSRSHLISIIIPNSVTDIGLYPFRDCRFLSSITVEDENLNYSSEDGVLFNKEKTTLISYPAAGIIDNYTISDGVIRIEPNAFSYSHLISVIIPNSVIDIGLYSFWECKYLSSITVKNENLNYSSEDGVLFNKEKTTLIAYPAGKVGDTYTIPNGVSRIEHRAFMSSHLVSLVIPRSVTDIGTDIFWDDGNVNSDGVDINVDWTTPLSISDNFTFNSVDLSKSKLIVPFGTKSQYQAADVWKEFGMIEEKAPVSVTNVSLNKTTTSLLVDETEQLTATVSPDNATNQKINWSSDDESVAMISTDGLVTAKTEGKAIITVTTEDGNKTATCTVTVTRPLNNDATLSSLSVNQGTLTPVFNPNVTDYTVSVTNSVTSITITATKNNEAASVSGDGTKSLNVGDNPIDIVVTAEDGTQKTYTVTVTRLLSSDATLSDLTVSEGTLTPAFDPNVTAYTVSVADTITSITITAMTNDAAASVSGDGTKELTVGENTFEIVATAEDGTEKTYIVVVTRLEPEIIAVTSISLNKTTADLLVDETEQLIATVLPDNATNQKVNWSSDEENIATVSTDGLVTAKAAGKAIITVTTEDGNKTATCMVTVEDNVSINNPSLFTITVNFADNNLYINSAVSETINIFSIMGIVLYHNEKPVGESYFNIGNIRDKVLIVKGGSGWVRKVIK